MTLLSNIGVYRQGGNLSAAGQELPRERSPKAREKEQPFGVTGRALLGTHSSHAWLGSNGNSLPDPLHHSWVPREAAEDDPYT